MAAWAVIPISPEFVIADIDAGLLFVLALTSMGVYGVILAGWASNSKYAFLGAMRSAAQMVAYEIAMGFALVGVLMAAGSLNLGEIVRAQEGGFASWNVWWLFPLFIVYLISGHRGDEPRAVRRRRGRVRRSSRASTSSTRAPPSRRCSRSPEYANMILISALAAVLFFGGWLSPVRRLPGRRRRVREVPLLGSWATLFWLFVKISIFLFIFLWVRATFPRYRYDQIMRLGWKVLIPITLVWIAVEGVLAWLKVGPWAA